MTRLMRDIEGRGPEDEPDEAYEPLDLTEIHETDCGPDIQVEE